MLPKTIGIRYPVWSSYGPAVLRGITSFSELHDPWRIVTENDSYGEMEAVRIDRDWEGDGLVLFRATDEELEVFRQKGIAVVVTSSEGPAGGFPRVIPDNAAIGRLAAEHLVSCGLPHYAFIGRGETLYLEPEHASGTRRYTRERLGGYKMAMAGVAKRPVVKLLTGRPLWEAGTWREVEEEVAEFMKQLPLPCGLFAADDALAAVVMRVAAKCGIRVPEDCALIGYGNDSPYCFASVPSLSTIAHPSVEIGRLAAQRLAEQFDGTGKHGRIDRLTLTTDDILPRGSSDTLGIPDPEIKKLVSFIRLNAPNDTVRVSELTTMTDLSLTTIKARFSEFLGHSPKEEIQRVRLQHLKALLKESRLPLPEIVDRMCFSSGQDLSRFFLRATGQSPTDYRAGSAAQPTKDGAGEGWGVVFDLDGTLIDTEMIYYEAYRRALEAQGFHLAPEEHEKEFTGACNAEIEKRVATLLPETFDQARFHREWRRHFTMMLTESPPVPLEGVIDALETLTERGVPVGLASSSDLAHIELSLEKAGLRGYFSILAAGDEVERGKPDPEVYLLCCERMGIDPLRSHSVEDSTRGVRAGVAAGLHVFLLTGGKPEVPQEKDQVSLVSSIAEVPWACLEPRMIG
ncbi:MAG: HAD family hydrolase [Verrucomicrobiaceae bacterium]|nr:MAG: HAD family hydrolase [Verrucomicrobiaceae bacterium]